MINVANVNIINSDGLIYFLNALRGLEGANVDLRTLELFGGGFGGLGCGIGCGTASSTLDVYGSSSAAIFNDVRVRSSTGANGAVADAAGAGITTGNAYAAANVVNVANTNMVDSNYLLFTFNNFGNWSGDMVLPGKDFFANFFGGRGTKPGNISTENTNAANVADDVTVGADTGGNNAEGPGVGVATGKASASASMLNAVNTNLFGGGSFTLLVRVHGGWSGNVFSTPPGIAWQETPSGVRLFDSGDGDAAGASGGDAGFGTVHVGTANDATVGNHVQVIALTGANKLAAVSGGAIHTGNAYAAANVMNLVNTNVVGRNWIWAIVNIFGDWSGNVAFGRPDLWIGSRAEMEGAGHPGPNAMMKYHYTIWNRGDADATGVRIENIFNPMHIAFEQQDHSWSGQVPRVSWELGTIPAGGVREVTYQGVVGNAFSPGQTPVTTTATVSSVETDANRVDNTDVVTFYVDRIRGGGDPTAGAQITLTRDPNLSIVKTHNAVGPITASSTVDYKIVVLNSGGTAYHAELVDVLRSEAGTMIHEERWPLDEIGEDEEITITYTTVFNAKTAPGIYTNTAEITAVAGHPSMNPFYGYFVHASPATTSVAVVSGGNVSVEDSDTGGDGVEAVSVVGVTQASRFTPAQLEKLSALAIELHHAEAMLALAVTKIAAAAAMGVSGAPEAMAASPAYPPLGGFPTEDGHHNIGSSLLAAINTALPASSFWWVWMVFLATLGVLWRLSRGSL